LLKMNLSRYVYFEALVKHISKNARKLTRSRQKIIDEIDDQIQRILAKQNGGYWPVTEGDKVFIHFLNRLKSSVQERIDKKALRELLSSARAQAEARLKIVFFAQETSVWPSLASFYEECAQDERFITQLVYVPFKHPYAEPSVDYLKIYKEKMGLDIITHDQYDVSAEGPDIAVFVKPYDGVPEPFYITEIDKVIRRCVYIPYGMEVGNAPQSLLFQYRLPLHYIAWMVVSYAPFYKKRAAQFGYRNGENYVSIGHPRIDLYLNNRNHTDEGMSYRIKANGRKIIMWNTHFTIEAGVTWGSYLEWGHHIFECFKNRPEVLLLWRPHPFFFPALAKVVGDDGVDRLVRELGDYENIVIDRSSTYLPAFFASDALITDATSFLPEYLATGKPILYTPKTGGAPLSDPSLLNDIYVVRRNMDIDDFVDMIVSSRDPMREQRLKSLPEHVTIPESGTVAVRLKNMIYHKLVAEEQTITAFA